MRLLLAPVTLSSISCRTYSDCYMLVFHWYYGSYNAILLQWPIYTSRWSVNDAFGMSRSGCLMIRATDKLFHHLGSHEATTCVSWWHPSIFSAVHGMDTAGCISTIWKSKGLFNSSSWESYCKSYAVKSSSGNTVRRVSTNENRLCSQYGQVLLALTIDGVIEVNCRNNGYIHIQAFDDNIGSWWQI